MAYKRYKSDINLSKQKKVQLMIEYIAYYENLIKESNINVLNIKIPREEFDNTLDEIGTLLNEKAKKMACEEGPVKSFLEANPLPPLLKDLLPDEFRAFSLLINALKQWVSAESGSTDRYILGGTARQTCRAAVKRCIVTGGELGEKPELHHPLRDGRPPILLSKKGHDLIEHNTFKKANLNYQEDDNEKMVWDAIMQLKKDGHNSWVQLREGCNAIISNRSSYRSGAKTFANKVIKETKKSASEILEMLDRKGLGE